jgi:hypothetical protein
MDLGFNYPFPWNAYGRYFGRGAPPGSEPELGRWLEELDKNLAVLRDRLGVRVVRLFLLCNGWNYGSVHAGRFVPPDQLHPAFGSDLTALLTVFRAHRMKVIPSLFDFKAFGRAWRDNGCGDRYDILRDLAIQRTVLEQTLGVFLSASSPYKDVIFAWEVMNEPAWNVRWLVPRSSAGGPTALARELAQFLERAVDLIDSYGFPSTVGHRFVSDLERFPTGTIRQFHFYPTGAFARALVDRTLPAFAATRAILGEFGVQPAGEQGVPWPELRGQDCGDTRTRTAVRLRHVRDKGYELALLWPDGLDGRGARSAPPGADPIQLSPAAQAGVEDFWRGGVLADEREQEGPEAGDEVAER